MSKIDTAKQEILTGSSKLYSQNEFNRTDYMIENMVSNRAYLSLSRNGIDSRKRVKLANVGKSFSILILLS